MVNQQSMTEQVEAASRAGQPVFDMVRGSIDGLPGFIAKSTTVKQVLPIVNRVTDLRRRDGADGRRLLRLYRGVHE